MASRFEEDDDVVHKEINIILVGKVGVGKSTVANHIIGKEVLSVSSSLSRATHSKEGRTTKDGVIYNITAIDTAGTVETDRRIRNELKSYAKRFPSGINLLLFVFKGARWTTDDNETIRCVQKNFPPEISTVSALVFTHCEQLKESQRKALEQEFHRDELTQDIANSMGKGIYVVGFPDLSEMRREQLKQTYGERINIDKEKLQKLASPCFEKRITLGRSQGFLERTAKTEPSRQSFRERDEYEPHNLGHSTLRQNWMNAQTTEDQTTTTSAKINDRIFKVIPYLAVCLGILLVILFVAFCIAIGFWLLG